MKRTITALLCAILLASLCLCACGEKPGPQADPAPKAAAAVPLLTLYADTKPMRIVTQQEGVSVAFQLLEYEPVLNFLRPAGDIWDEVLEPGKDYELETELAEGIPQYRIYARKGDLIAVYDLVYDGKDGKEIIEIEGKPWAPAPIDGNSPMVNLCRTAAVAKSDAENYSYSYAVSNAICTLRGVYNEWPPDGDSEAGNYLVPPWLFKAYAAALFPDIDLPEYVDWMWVGYDDTDEVYLAYLAYSTWIWAEYKSAKQNPDGTWDVTVTIGTTEDDGTMDETIKLAPNETYNPDSPFEYHIVDMPQPPEPSPPPPEYVVGTWKAPLGSGNVCYLEIFPDGMAGLYKGDANSSQVYEIYNGTVSHMPGNVSEIYTFIDMEFTLNWYIYEGEGELNLPETFKGTYGFDHDWEGDQQVLRVVTSEGDNLYGKKELKMLWVPKTNQGDCMVDIEAMG